MTSNHGRLAGKAALNAGADSDSDRCGASRLADEGANVALAFHASAQDADDPARCREAVRSAEQDVGRLDVLVNSAADTATRGYRSEDTLDSAIASCLRRTRAALPDLKPGASIINTGAMQALNTALAANLHDRGIHVLTAVS